MWMCSNSYTHALLGPYLKESLDTFVVGHWSVSRRMTSRHFSGKNSEDLIFLSFVCAFRMQQRTTTACGRLLYTWLVNHLSKEGDAVVDVCGRSGYAMVAALKAGQKALQLSSAHIVNLKHYSQGFQPSYCDKTLNVTLI